MFIAADPGILVINLEKIVNMARIPFQTLSAFRVAEDV